MFYFMSIALFASKTPHISPTFSISPRPFPGHFQIPRLLQVLQVGSHPEHNPVCLSPLGLLGNITPLTDSHSLSVPVVDCYSLD